MKAHSLGAILCAFVFGCLVWVVACSGRTIDSVSDDGSSGGSDDAGASWTDAPRFGLPSGRYETPQPITITSNTPDATIHYTVDDSPPSTASPIYEKPILVGYGTTTIRAIATAEGHLDSQITWATYTIEAAPLPKVAAPVFAPPPGSYEAPLSVSISTSTPGATIHYTVDDTGPDLGSPVYEGAILLKDGVFHIKAFAVANGYDDSTVSTATYDVEEEFCNYSAPTFVPPGGTYGTPQLVSISTSTIGAEIFFTLDGTEPTKSSTKYEEPIWVDVVTTIKAVSIHVGDPSCEPSPTSTATYTFSQFNKAALPVFSLPSGTYHAAQTVAITSATPNATIYYTLNGTEPTVTSPVYTAPVIIAMTTMMKAVTVAPGFLDSDVATAHYTISPIDDVPPPPTFSPPGGTYDAPLDVSISSTTPGAVIYYTTDGTTPTTASFEYTAPVHVAQTTVLKAFATAVNYSPSLVSTAIYTISPLP